MNKSQKQLILRTIAVVISLLALFFMIYFDAFMMQDQLDGNTWGYSNHPVYWFTFWTHLSNLGAILWAFLAWIALVFKIERLENIINGQYIKNLVFTFIIITGIVFMLIAYIPILWAYTNDSWISEHFGDNISNYRFYEAMQIITTTFKHLLVPGIFLIMAIFDGEYTPSKHEVTPLQKAKILFIVPVLYIIWILLLSSYAGANVPYPIFNFSGTEKSLWIPFVDSYILTYIIDIVCILVVGATFIIISMFTSFLSIRMRNKHESTEEIVEGFDLS